MRYWTSFAKIKKELSGIFEDGLVVTVGNFDGVHRGHQRILERVKTISKKHGWFSLVVTFQEHTSLILRHQAPLMLMSLEDRSKYFAKMGMDGCLALAFTPELAQLPAVKFLEQLVALGTKAFIVGHDFTFGAGGIGDTRFLLDFTKGNDLYGEVIPPVKYEGEIVCSSKIRKLLTAGRVAEANGMLNHPFRLSGLVQPGDQRGRILGFPTANLNFPAHRLLPKFGVYLVKIYFEGKDYYGLANVGCKPTFNHNNPLVEVHIFEFSADIYGRFLAIEFLKFLRVEQKFTLPGQLQAQMEKDKQRGEELLAAWGMQ